MKDYNTDFEQHKEIINYNFKNFNDKIYCDTDSYFHLRFNKECVEKFILMKRRQNNDIL